MEKSDDNLPPNHYWYRDALLSIYYPRDHVDRLLDKFQFRESDIVLATYPRSGTLLTQEIIWQIKHRHIIEAGKSYGTLKERFPYIELHMPKITPNFIDILEKKAESEQRFIKTHLPQHVIFNKIKHCRKIVVVYRDAKDVAVSYFHFYQNFVDFEDWPPNWDTFFKYFVDGKIMYGSHFKWNGDWFKLGNHSNILFIKYEDIVTEKATMIKRLAEFLDEPDITEEQINIIVKNTSFKEMSNNKDVNAMMHKGKPIMRKGVVGDYKNYFTEEQEKLTDSLTHEYIDTDNPQMCS